jgi:hypothetical protein
VADEKKKDERKEVVDLVLSSTKSLHRPLKIEVEGKIYTSTLLSKHLFNKLQILQTKAEDGDSDAAYEQIKLVFGVPKTHLYKLDMRDINVISELVLDTLMKSERYRTEQEKKLEGPGEKNSV